MAVNLMLQRQYSIASYFLLKSYVSAFCFLTVVIPIPRPKNIFDGRYLHIPFFIFLHHPQGGDIISNSTNDNSISLVMI